jgi:hypothetical protein
VFKTGAAVWPRFFFSTGILLEYGHFPHSVLIESAMPGYAHLIHLGLRDGTYGRTIGEYQFTYNDGKNSWVRTFDGEPSLAEFLIGDVAVPPDVVDGALDQLRAEGHVTLAEIDIRESEAPAMGLEQLPSES